MDLTQLKRDIYLFSPEPFGRIFAFVDFANVRYWARSFWPDENKFRLTREIDIEKLALLLNLVSPLRSFFYYGHYRHHDTLPADHEENLKHARSVYRIRKARQAGFSVRTKEVKEISTFDHEGISVGVLSKCNFDVEITMDLLVNTEKYDTILMLSGDSDFHHVLSFLKKRGKQVITVCARDFMSRELNEVSHRFIAADGLKDLLEYQHP